MGTLNIVDNQSIIDKRIENIILFRLRQGSLGRIANNLLMRGLGFTSADIERIIDDLIIRGLITET